MKNLVVRCRPHIETPNPLQPASTSPRAQDDWVLGQRPNAIVPPYSSYFSTPPS
jgi:hypothetical protein